MDSIFRLIYFSFISIIISSCATLVNNKYQKINILIEDETPELIINYTDTFTQHSFDVEILRSRKDVAMQLRSDQNEGVVFLESRLSPEFTLGNLINYTWGLGWLIDLPSPKKYQYHRAVKLSFDEAGKLTIAKNYKPWNATLSIPAVNTYYFGDLNGSFSGISYGGVEFGGEIYVTNDAMIAGNIAFVPIYTGLYDKSNSLTSTMIDVQYKKVFRNRIQLGVGVTFNNTQGDTRYALDANSRPYYNYDFSSVYSYSSYYNYFETNSWGLVFSAQIRLFDELYLGAGLKQYYISPNFNYLYFNYLFNCGLTYKIEIF
jgi:hypothetical protein